MPNLHWTRVGLGTLRANPLRAILSTLGIIIGVAALVAVLSLGDGMERMARDRIAETNLQFVTVSPQTTRVVDGVRLPRPDTLLLGEKDLPSVTAVLPEGSEVSLAATGRALVQGWDGSQHGSEITAVSGADTPDPFLGRVPAGAAPASGAMVSRTLAERLAGDDSLGTVTGRSIRVNGSELAIVGVFDLPDGIEAAMVTVPVEGASEVLGVPTVVTTLRIRAPSVEEVSDARTALEGWLDEHNPGSRDRVSIGTYHGYLEELQRAILIFKIFMGAITGISLLVGGIGIMNVLLSSVLERTREIGIRKSIGANRRDILLQFLAESVAITGVGSLIGVLVGFGMASGAAAVMRHQVGEGVTPVLTPGTLLFAVGVSVVIGLTFGLFPALRAARLSPIEAMRHE
jgi:putative ABC transport system permease protein